MNVLKPNFPDQGSPFSREHQRERRRNAIVSAAARHFDRDGFHAARLEDIAASLGLTKNSIGYYFETKDDLVREVYRVSYRFLADAVTQAKNSEGGASEKLLALFRAYASQWAAVAANQRPYAAAINDLYALKPDLRAEVAEQASLSVTGVDALVRAWLQETHAPLGRSEPVTFFIFGVLDWMDATLPRQDAAAIAESTNALLDLVANGLVKKRTRAPVKTPNITESVDVPQIFDREARNRMKREAFLQAGARLFNQMGYGGVALSEVAASLGVSRGAFYYQLADKEDLLDQCLDRSYAIVETALSRAETGAPNGIATIEQAVCDLIYRQCSGVTPLVRPGLASALPKPRQRRYETRRRNIERRFGDALSGAISEGHARDVDVAIIEQLLANAVFLNGGYTIVAANSFSNWRVSEDPLNASIDYTHILMRGLKA